MAPELSSVVNDWMARTLLPGVQTSSDRDAPESVIGINRNQ